MWNEQEKAFCIAAYLRSSDLVETRKLYLCRFNVDRHRINQTPRKGQVIRWAKMLIHSKFKCSLIHVIDHSTDQSRPGCPRKNLRRLQPPEILQLSQQYSTEGLLEASSIGIWGNIISLIHQKFRLHGFRNTSMNGTSA